MILAQTVNGPDEFSYISESAPATELVLAVVPAFLPPSPHVGEGGVRPRFESSKKRNTIAGGLMAMERHPGGLEAKQGSASGGH